MAGISFSGLASGMDTESMITQLMSIERAPRARLVLQQSAARARQDALNAIDGKLDLLRTAATDLSSSLTWTPQQSITVGDTTKATATITGGAGPGVYSLIVNKLATAEQRTYTYTPKNNSQTFTIDGQALSVSANESLDSLVSRINGDTKYGVYAVNSGGNLVLASRTTGTAGAITTSSTGGIFSENTALAKPGVNASYSIDGTTYSSSSNTISSTSGATGFIMGAEIQLKAVTTGTTIEVSPPGVDKSAITAKVKAFVDAYNAAQDLMRSKVTEKRVPNATTDADIRKGVLFGDMTVTSAMSTLRNAVTDVFSNIGNTTDMDTLAEIGISTGAASGSSTFSQDAVDGKLQLDTTKLQAALDKDPLAVQRLLGGASGVSGFAQSFQAKLDPYAQTGGILSQRADAAGTEIKGYDDSLARMDQRLATKEESLRRMFTALEVALQKSRTAGTEMLAKLGVSNNG